MIDGAKSSLSVEYGIDPAISDAIFGTIVYGAAIISIFYFLVPYKWYVRIFKGKAYADNYQNYINAMNKNLDDANSVIYYLKLMCLNKPIDNHFDQHLINERLKQFQIKPIKKLDKALYKVCRNKVYQRYEELRLEHKEFFLQLIIKEMKTLLNDKPNKEQS
jgi:hypothetical protein